MVKGKQHWNNTDFKNRRIRVFEWGIMMEVKPQEFDRFLLYAERNGFRDEAQKAIYDWTHDTFTVSTDRE